METTQEIKTAEKQYNNTKDAPLSTETLRYLGKMLKSEGVGKKGEWKLYQLQFDSGGNYPWKCSAFTSLSPKGIRVSDMIEGNFYEVWYKVTEYTNEYGAQKGKQATLIKDSTEDKQTNPLNKVSPQAQPTKTIGEIIGNAFEFNADTWSAFATEYDTATENHTDTTPMSMLGVYIANHYAGSFPELINACKAHFKKPVEEQVVAEPKAEKKPLEV